MATSNNNKPVDMKQLWQQMEPFPVASSALSAMTTSEDGTDRFMYYLSGSNFYRYDSYGNAPQKLASPLVAPTVFASIRYSKFAGTLGRVISQPSSNVLRIPGINGSQLIGSKLRIISGKGAGQVRTVVGSDEPLKYDQGVATTASVTSIGDNTKKWKFNQWSGYQVRLTFSTGQTQVRRILYNDATTLYVSDVNYQALDPFNNLPFTVAPITTAGSQTHFVIEAVDVTVDTAFTVAPDYTSKFKVETGGVWLLTSLASAPFLSLQYYDAVMDVWSNRTVPTNLILAAFGTDGTLERTGEVGGIYQTGNATSGSTFLITDTSASMVVDRYINYRVRITAGTGIGQSRRIVKNGVNYLEVARKWEVTPDATSVYEVIADKDKFYIGGNAQSFLMQYDVDSDLMIQGSKYDDGIANNLACRSLGIDAATIGINSGTRGTGGITAVGISTAGSGYAVGDIITLATGTNGKVQVTSINAGGVVTGVQVLRPGSGYSVTTFAQSTTTGVGTGFVASVTAVSTICNVVTSINHNIKIGDQVVLSGDALYAGTVTVIGCDSLTGFDFVTTAASNMTALASNSATLIVDSTKNWTVNEHVGKIIQTHVVGLAGAVQPRVITANTATTITVASITTALAAGTGRYVITDPSMFGRDEQFKIKAKSNVGNATGGSTTTLIDSTKDWTVNSWVGAKVRIQAGTGRDAFITVISNTATTLTYATQAFTPDATTRYLIQDSFGTCTAAGSTTTLVDSTKLWTVNQWAGKKVRITGGAGFGLAAASNEITIISNTATTLTFTAITGFAPDATTTYTILSIPPRGLGIDLIWAFGGVSAGRFMWYPRGGGSNTLDRYDVTREVFEYALFLNPQTDVFTTGSYYAYDGVDRIYLSPGVPTGVVQYVYYLDLITLKVSAFGSVPNTQLAPVIGNRMEIITSPAGIDYLYHVRNSGTEMYRAQIWF